MTRARPQGCCWFSSGAWLKERDRRLWSGLGPLLSSGDAPRMLPKAVLPSGLQQGLEEKGEKQKSCSLHAHFRGAGFILSTSKPALSGLGKEGALLQGARLVKLSSNSRKLSSHAKLEQGSGTTHTPVAPMAKASLPCGVLGKVLYVRGLCSAFTIPDPLPRHQAPSSVCRPPLSWPCKDPTKPLWFLSFQLILESSSWS